MKNLRVFPARLRDLANDAIGFCVDADNDTIFIISERLNISKTSLENRTGAKSLVKVEHNFAELLKAKITKNFLLCFEYLVEFNSVLVGLRDGNIFRIGVANNDVVNYHHKHLRNLDSVQISPSQDLIALSDSENNIFLLNTDFEQVAESNALTNENSKHKSVGVGWGSKETQFFGLDGRPSKEGQAKETIKLTDEELELYDKVEASPDFCDYMRSKESNTIIDWRGDGQYIASLTYISEIDKHQLKVWNKGLNLQYMSDKLINIERGLLHWVPNGNFVCCAQRREKKINEILSLEKNGMIHMRLELPTLLNNLYVDDFSWSPDSSILAVLLRKYDQEQKKELIKRRTMLMLFTLSNHKYYLKHSRYLNESDIDYSLKWNANDNTCLFILSEKGFYLELRVTPYVDYSDDKGNIVVIDGNKLLITPLKICLVPPPMSAFVLELPELIKGVGLLKNKANRMAILTVNDNIILIDKNYQPNPESPTKVVCNQAQSKSTSATLSDRKYHHIISIPDDNQYDLIVPIPVLSNSVPGYIAARFTDKGCELHYMHIAGELSALNTKFLGLITCKHIISVVIQKKDIAKGCLARIIKSDGSVDKVIESIKSEPPIPVIVSSKENSLTRPLYNLLQSEFDVLGRIIILSPNQTLSCEAKIISSKECTSFRLTSQFLLYTTSCNLRFVPLRNIDKPGVVTNWSQKIENGGHLIFVDPEEARVVLQMPRGNLEVIHPRLLVLCLVRKLMAKRSYLAAIKIARRHRLDMNFLADCLIHYGLDGDIYHSIQQFTRGLLTDKKEGESLLILFLNELVERQEEFFGRYSSLLNFIPQFEEDFKDQSPPRVPKLHCVDTPYESRYDLILKPLMDILDELPLKVLLMIGIKIKPEDFVESLRLLAQNAKTDKDFDDGIKFLLYHGQVNELYNDAIKAHETKLALMIAKKSSKDPKEYLPVLHRFNSIESSVLKFYEMSLYVNDNERALKYLIKYHIDGELERSGAFPNIIELIDKKKLYKSALENFLHYAIQAPNCKSAIERFIEVIATKFAAYMLAKRYYLQAGLLYSIALRLTPSSTIHFNGGVKCFELCDRVDLSYPLYAKYTPEDPKDKMEALKKLSSSLISDSKPFDATVVRMYMDEVQKKSDIDAFVMSGTTGYYYADLLGGANLTTREQIFEENMSFHVVKFRRDWDDHIEEALGNFGRLKDLISIYFSKRNEQGLTYLYSDDTLSTTDGSDVSSLESGSKNQKKSISGSLKTRDTSKTTKSQAARKKRLNFKRGSRYEDIAVIIKLREFIEVNKKNQQTAVDLLVQLYEFGYDFSKKWFVCQREANFLRDSMKRSYESSKIIIDTFWPATADIDTDFSLFERFHDALTKPADEIETIDIEILVRPSMPKEPNYLELFSFHSQAN